MRVYESNVNALIRFPRRIFEFKGTARRRSMCEPRARLEPNTANPEPESEAGANCLCGCMCVCVCVGVHVCVGICVVT